jgi:hypothetical protein
MLEDAPTSTKHCHRRHVMGVVQGTVPGEVPVQGIQ